MTLKYYLQVCFTLHRAIIHNLLHYLLFLREAIEGTIYRQRREIQTGRSLHVSEMERMKTTPLYIKSQITRLSPAGPLGFNAWLIDFTSHRETETTGCNDFKRHNS